MSQPTGYDFAVSLAAALTYVCSPKPNKRRMIYFLGATNEKQPDPGQVEYAQRVARALRRHIFVAP